ncbi:hypothetical protein D0861_05615 [Hortaea werneckii]|uniref:Uncharacterized protein n=1 Tax=Hortaea werneckii TaxID=91943 RepID=A0A3M7FDT4_HORWE|nr:hypothetical protein D0861_05615 [Hortaea werneckii]
MAALQDPSKIAGTEAGQEPAGLHKQLLDQKNGKQGDTYVSPSDAIMSPASQKLQGFKQRQINKQRFVHITFPRKPPPHRLQIERRGGLFSLIRKKNKMY